MGDIPYLDGRVVVGCRGNDITYLDGRDVVGSRDSVDRKDDGLKATVHKDAQTLNCVVFRQM